jgi:hypothetical protein
MTRDPRAAVERGIRRRGREVVEPQLVVARVADTAIELYVRAATPSRTQALLDAHTGGAAEAPPLTSTRIALDDASVERLPWLCDLPCQRSGLRFRSARVALNDDRDAPLRRRRGAERRGSATLTRRPSSRRLRGAAELLQLRHPHLDPGAGLRLGRGDAQPPEIAAERE